MATFNIWPSNSIVETGEKPNYCDGFRFPELTGMVSDPTALEPRSNTINRTLFICPSSSMLLEKAIPFRRALSRSTAL